MIRIDKENYYLDIAQTVLERGTCLRRNFGAIIVNNDQIISSGYTGAPRGRKNCMDLGKCTREAYLVVSAMSCVALYTPRPMRLFMQHETICWEQPCTL